MRAKLVTWKCLTVSLYIKQKRMAAELGNKKRTSHGEDKNAFAIGEERCILKKGFIRSIPGDARAALSSLRTSSARLSSAMRSGYFPQSGGTNSGIESPARASRQRKPGSDAQSARSCRLTEGSERNRKADDGLPRPHGSQSLHFVACSSGAVQSVHMFQRHR